MSSLLASLAILALLLVDPDPNAPQPPAPEPEPVVEEEAAPEPVYLSPREYLYASYPSNARKLDCMISLESTWNPNAATRLYAGLAQFDYGTWLETPQGKAGLSRYDPYASIDALAWGVVHLGYGRWPVTSRRC